MAGVDADVSVIDIFVEVERAAGSLVFVCGEQAANRNTGKTPNIKIPLANDFIPGKYPPGPQASFLFAFQFHWHVFPGQPVQTQAPGQLRALPGRPR